MKSRMIIWQTIKPNIQRRVSREDRQIHPLAAFFAFCDNIYAELTQLCKAIPKMTAAGVMYAFFCLSIYFFNQEKEAVKRVA
jgi:hypothetical protein